MGRKKEIDDLVNLLKNPDIRLITLHGFGGTGKTRLAVELGRTVLDLFPDGVWFVALDPLSSPDHIISATAAALGFAFHGPEDQKSQLTCFLRDKKLFLIFDSLEHLLPDGSTYLYDLYQNVTEAKFLVTTRQPLNVVWEWVYPLHGLEYEIGAPGPKEDMPAAVQLFLQHLGRVTGTAVGSDPMYAAQICQMVRGIPLALILAASWGRTLGCEEIAREIQQGISFLQIQQRNFPEKHSSMQAVFNHSWQFLSDQEKFALQKLVIFQGGFDRQSAADVAGAGLPIIAALVDKSLVERVSKDRFQIHELLRQYLKERLTESGEERWTRGQHLACYAKTAKRAEHELVGEQFEKWAKWFNTEIDNIRAALEWSLENRSVSSLQDGLSLMLKLDRLWQQHPYLKEGLKLINRLLTALPNELRPRLYAEGLNFASELSYRLRNYAEARRLAVEVVKLGLELNDLSLVGDAYYSQALEAFMRNDLVTSHSFARDALESYQKIEVPLKTALTINLIGDIEFYLGNFAVAFRHHMRALDVTRALRDESSIAVILQSLASLAAVDPSIGLEKSRTWIEEGMQYASRANDITLVQTFLMYKGEILRQEGRYEDAIAIYEETVRTINDAVSKEEYIVIWLNLGFAYFRVGEYDRSRQIFLDNLAEILKIKRNIYHELPHCLLGIAGVAVVEGKARLAATILGSLEIHKKTLVFWPTDRSEYERISAFVKAQLTEKQFNQLYKEGQTLSLADSAQLVQNQGINGKSQDEKRPSRLTNRELEILRLVAQGLSDAQVAEQLVLSRRTVNAHLTSIYNKLGVNSRVAATRFALEKGLV